MLAELFEKRFHVKQEPPGWVVSGWGWDTASGVEVNPETALNYSAVYSCIRILAETIASLPLPVYERLANGGKERATSHYLYPILHDAPNPEMTSIEFREALQGHLATWGNAYSEIEFNNAGQVAALWPLRPDKMTVKRENGQLQYIYRLPSGESRPIATTNILHLRGFGSNGLTGYSVIALARQSIGLGLATEEFGARFFGHGAQPGGVLEHPGKLSPDAHKRMHESWEESHKGLEYAHRVAILEEGVKYQAIGIPPDDAQFLETRKFQVTEIARWFRIPPHMLADLDRATFSNIEEQGLEFVIYSLLPWLVRWEQRLGLSLLMPAERKRYFVEHLVNGLLRGDIQKRSQAYATGRQWGWLSANDVRTMENMNPVDGGDMYLVPLNMVPADQAGEMEPSQEGDSLARAIDQRSLPPVETRARKQANRRHRLARSYRKIYKEALSRVLRREKNDLIAGAKKYLGQRDMGQFSIFLEEFYQEHAKFIRKNLDPIAFSYGEEAAASAQEDLGKDPDWPAELERFVNAYMSEYAGRHIAMSKEKIRKILQKALEDGNLDLESEFDAELEAWPEVRADDIAFSESVRFGNAVALTAWALGGAERIMSVAFGKSCPYCSSLDGRVIGITQYFLAAGEELQPDGADKPLKVQSNCHHGPYHGGCDCGIAVV